jgi:hypothetical protein
MRMGGAAIIAQNDGGEASRNCGVGPGAGTEGEGRATRHQIRILTQNTEENQGTQRVLLYGNQEIRNGRGMNSKAKKPWFDHGLTRMGNPSGNNPERFYPKDAAPLRHEGWKPKSPEWFSAKTQRRKGGKGERGADD